MGEAVDHDERTIDTLAGRMKGGEDNGHTSYKVKYVDQIDDKKKLKKTKHHNTKSVIFGVLRKNQKTEMIGKAGATSESFGTNPRDPWSTKANIAEDSGLLNLYLKSKGLNPSRLSREQKMAQYHTNEFKEWKKNWKTSQRYA
jgi:hypothetical protein